MKIKLESVKEHTYNIDIERNEGISRLRNVQLTREEYNQLTQLTKSIIERHIESAKKR